MARCPGLHCEGCGDGGLPAGLIAGGAAVAAIAAVVAFVVAHLVILTIAAAVIGTGTLGSVLALKRFMVPRGSLDPQSAALHAAVTQAVPAQKQRPAIAAPVHQHIHFHGVSAEDIATIVAAQRPAIREDQSWSSE